MMDNTFDIELRHGFAATEHSAAECIPMTTDVFGQRMHDIVCTELQRSSCNRRGECRIDRELGAGRMSDLGCCGDVGQLDNGVAGRFDPDQAGVGPDSLLDVCDVRGVYRHHRDT